MYAGCQKLYMRSLWFDLRGRDFLGPDFLTSFMFRRQKKNNLNQQKNNYYVLVHKNAQQILALQFKKKFSGAYDHVFL